MNTEVLQDERKMGWYHIDNEIIDTYGARMGPYGIAVYNVIARHADKNGGAFPSYQTIADKVGIGRAKAVQTVTLLVNLGLIRKDTRIDAAGDASSNQYTLIDVHASPQKPKVVSSEYHPVSNENYPVSNEYHPSIPQEPQVVSHVDTNNTQFEKDKVKEDERESIAEPPQPLSLFEKKPDEYTPGVFDPRNKRNEIAELVFQAKTLGITPEQFTKNTDALLDGFGKTAIAKVDDANGDKVLKLTKGLALTLAKMDQRFRTENGIISIFLSWKANDYRGDSVPGSDQLIEHASLMLSGKVVCTRKKQDVPTVQSPPVKDVLTFKKWCLDKYNTTYVEYIPGISETMIRDQYEQYKRQSSQQAH